MKWLMSRWVALGHTRLHRRRARLKLAHCPAEIIQLALIFDLLALGEFQRLQQLIQFFHDLLQRLDDVVNILHGLCHG